MRTVTRVQRWCVAVLGAAALTLCPAVGVAAPRVPTPGAAGIGDPYWPTDGNGGYDVQHYDLRLSYAPVTDVLRGVATLQVTATQDLSRFNLDLDELTVDSIRVNQVPATWTRVDDELRITPAVALSANQTFTVMIGYHGVPVPVDDEFGISGFYTTGDGAIIAGQPHVADTWFPSNDHPADKATYRIAVTAPQDLQVVANGALVGTSRRAGQQTWSWSVRQPMASYLATFAVGKFDLTRYRSGRLEYLDAIDPALDSRASTAGGTIGARAQAALNKQPAIITFLSGVMGPYPFDQVGGVVDNRTIGFALENQTRPVYDPSFFNTSTPWNDDSVVVHELAHQWAGDSVALERWSDIWLNEGFATFAEWLWAENQGRFSTTASFAEAVENADYTPGFWNIEIGDPGAADLFAEATYDRGAMTLYELRRVIGAAAFAQLVKTWFSTHAQGNATTQDFIALAESVSGRDLDAFFEKWLFTPSRPADLPPTVTGERRAAPTPSLRPHRR